MNITCPKCKGSGCAPLSNKLQAVVDTVRALKKPTIPDIYRNLPESHRTVGKNNPREIIPTAVNRRVERLVGLGVLRMKKDGVVEVVQ